MDKEQVLHHLGTLVDMVDQLPETKNLNLKDQYAHVSYDVDIAPHYVIAKIYSDQPLVYTDVIVVLIRSLKTQIPLAFYMHFAEGRLAELELFCVDSSIIDYSAFWTADQNILSNVTYEVLMCD